LLSLICKCIKVVHRKSTGLTVDTEPISSVHKYSSYEKGLNNNSNNNNNNNNNTCYHLVQSFLSSHLLSRNGKVKIYKTAILPVVLYGCETWSVTLQEEHRLKVFENRVLRRIFVTKRDEVTGEWRKFHSEKLHILYSSPNIITQIKSRRMRWEGHVACMGEERKVYRVLVRKPQGKEPLGRPRRRWEDGIRMHPREIGWKDVEWVKLAQDRGQWWAVVNAVMNLQVLVLQS
jgi:hypothetical protein